MTGGDRDAIEALVLRVRHIEATACLIAAHSELPRDETDAVAGIAAQLAEIGERLDTIARSSGELA